MKRKRDYNYKRKNWDRLARALFAVFAVMALLAGPGFVQSALADIKSDLEAKIDNQANPMGLEEAAEAVMAERLAAGEKYEDILAELVDAATAIATERGWNVEEAVALVKSGARKEGEAKGVAPPSTTTSTSTSTTSSTTSTTTTTTKESTVSPSS